MVKVVENGERICTVTLDGSESSVVFQNDYKYFAVKNESDAAVYVSLNRDIVEGADGVMKIGSKESVLFPCMKPNVNMFFVKGTGKIQVCASSIPVNPFKSAPVATGGGGDVSEIAAILGNLSQFFAGENHSLADLIKFWIDVGDLKDPKCYPLIPTLTSNDGSNGTASCNSDVTFGTAESAYYSFDNNTATFIAYTSENVSGGWVMYEFNSPVCISKMSALTGTGMTGNSFDFHFEYYDDASGAWVIFGNEMNVSGLNQGNYKNFEMVSDYVTTSKVRIISNTEKVEKTNWNVFEFQVYGYMA